MWRMKRSHALSLASAILSTSAVAQAPRIDTLTVTKAALTRLAATYRPLTLTNRSAFDRGLHAQGWTPPRDTVSGSLEPALATTVSFKFDADSLGWVFVGIRQPQAVCFTLHAMLVQRELGRWVGRVVSSMAPECVRDGDRQRVSRATALRSSGAHALAPAPAERRRLRANSRLG
jgi:hypothetical protein